MRIFLFLFAVLRVYLIHKSVVIDVPVLRIQMFYKIFYTGTKKIEKIGIER